MDTHTELDTPDTSEALSTVVPRALLRGPFLAKELGALRYLAACEGGVVAMFAGGLSLHLRGDVRALAVALANVARPAAT